MKGEPALGLRRGLARLCARRLCNHIHPPAADRELDDTVGQCVKRVIAAQTDVAARMEAGAALADDDAACPDRLAAVDLDA